MALPRPFPPPCRRAAILSLAALLLTLAPAQAQSPSDGLVVRGRVAGARSAWDAARTLQTFVTIDVTEVVVGAAVPRQLVLRQLGGEVGGIGLWIAGQAGFGADEDVLLDLDLDPRDGTLRTRGLGRGKWRVEDIDGTLFATRGSGLTEERRPYLAVRDDLLKGRRAAATFTAMPAEYAPMQHAAALAFSYLPTEGGFPARWHEVDSGTPLFVDRPAFPPTWSHASASHVTNAINLWRGSGMDLDLREGGSGLSTSDCPALSFTGNGRIALAFNDPCPGGIPDWVIGGGYYTTGDLRTVNGVTFQKFLQGFVVLNDAGSQATSAGCFQDAITHGLGHALGLGHSGAGGAIMQQGPPAGCTSGPSSLGADDVQGITSIYEGQASAPQPPNAPTAMTATATLSNVTLSWTPASTGGAAQRYLIDAGQAPGIYNIGTIPINAPATSTGVGGVPAGTYYVRVRASNALGTSGPSPEASVTVGGCAPPGAPASYTASTNDMAVFLQWTAGTGVVQGYQLEAGTAPGLANLVVLPLPATPLAFGASVPYGRYYTRLRSTNVCGVSPPSTEVILDVRPCTATPGAPTGLVFNVANRVVGMAWTAPAGTPPTGYSLVVGSVPGGSDLLVYPTGTTATSIAAPAPPGTYYVRVVATNACGASLASNEITVVVP